MKIYYAHCMLIYNSPQEKRDLETLKILFPNDEIINPSELDSTDGYMISGMEFFYNIIRDCQVFVFRANPGGKIPSGIVGELGIALEQKIPIIELPSLVDRSMSLIDTRHYLHETGQR